MQVSKTGVSLIVFILASFDINVTDGDVTQTIGAIMQIVSFIGIIYGQFSRKDLNFGLFRK